MQIILASQSPRRLELLKKTGLKFRVVASPYEEDMSLPKAPRSLARFLALEKAKAAAYKVAHRPRQQASVSSPGEKAASPLIPKFKNAIVIGADTLVVCKGKIYGKPKTKNEARDMLRSYRNTYNTVITGFAIIDTSTGHSMTRAVLSKVYFKPLTEKEIEAYIATGDPFDKSGGYSVQGLAKHMIAKVEGPIDNVIGLPVAHVLRALKQLLGDN